MLVLEPLHLRFLSDALHDLWFDVDRLQKDSCEEVVTIPLYKGPADLKRGRAFAVWTIRYVLSVVVRDTEQVGCYDINHIQLDPRENVLTVIGNIPVVVLFHLAKLHMELTLL